jgi:ribosomal protein S18 acetylase RimI-like enzyme
VSAAGIIHGNLREALRFFGEATGRGQVRQLEHATAIYSGLDYGVFNIALLEPSAVDAARSLAACAEFFEPRCRRWSVWLCEDSLAPEVLHAARTELAARGLREISSAPGMMAAQLAAPRRELPTIVCEPVNSEQRRREFGALTATCFDIPMGVARQVYFPEAAWRGAYRGYLGTVAGRAVGAVALVETGDTLGVYSLGIEPESRRLGYGEALLRAAVEARRAQGGITRIVLQASEAAESLYRHMGFRAVTRFSIYLTK